MATDALPFSSPIEMNGWEARHFVVHNASAAPTTYAREGQIYWDTVEKQLKIDTANGANWQNLLRQGKDYTINDAWTVAQAWDFTANFTITDTTKIANLNADLVDGLHTSVTAVNNTIIARDGNGRAQINDPVADKDITNKLYVDSLIAGRAYEIPAMVAIDANIDISNPGTATYDGVTLVNGDRVLLINQTNPVQNGLFVWNGVGAALSRPTDSDSPNSNAIETSSNININNPGTSTFGGVVASPGDIVFLRAQTDPAENGPYTFNGSSSAMTSYTVFADLIPGSGVFVKKGTEYGGGQFNVSSPQAKKAISIDVDQQVWTQTNAQQIYTADGQGLELVGTQFRLEVDNVTLQKTSDHVHIHPNYAGQASITTLGTIGTGTWQANTVAANYGGTGQTTYAQGDLLYYNGTSTQLARLGLGGLFQVLMSDGTRPTWLDLTVGLIDTSNFAAGSVIFSNGTFFDADTTNFFYDDANNRFGLGNSTPQTQFHMKGTAPTIRLEQTGGNAGFGEITASTSYGDLIYTANAGGAGGVATHTWKHSTSTIAQMSAQGYLNLGGSARAFTAGLDVAAPSTNIPTAIFTLRDNLASSFQIKEGSNNYISIDTNNGAEKIVFGNTSTDPYYHFKGDNSLIIGEDPTIGIGNITDRLYVDGTMFSDTIQSQRIGRQGGYHLDGSNDYIELPKIAFGTGDFTLCFDLQHDDTPGGTEIISEVSAGNNRWSFNATATSYQLKLTNSGGTTTTYTFTVTPTATRRSVAVTADRDGDAKLYINGRLIATADISGLSATNLGDSNDSPIRLGASSSSFDGKIYEARFYSVAKTHTEVINIAQGFNDRANLELHFSESSTETWGWRDISSNDRHGVNYGAARIESPISRSYVNHSEFAQWQKKDGGYKYNGANLFHVLPHLDLGTGDFSFIFSITHENAPVGTEYIFLKPSASGHNRFVLRIANSNIWEITFVNSSGVGSIYQVSVSSMSGHAVYGLTFDRDGDFSIYVNGSIMDSVDISGSSSVDLSLNTSSYYLSFSSGALDGSIHEVRVFNRALTSSDVAKYSRGEVTAQSDIANLLAHYTPESATPTLWEDVSGNEKHAVNNGATHLRPTLQESYVLEQSAIAGRVGTGPSYNFRSNSNVIHTGLNLSGYTDFTMFADVFVENLDSTQFIFSDYESSVDIKAQIAIAASGTIEVYFYNGGTSNYTRYRSPEGIVTLGHHNITVTRKSGEVKIYVNGKSGGSITETILAGTGAPAVIPTSARNISLGRRSNLTLNNLIGNLSQARVFNRALTADEVAQVSNGQNLGFADYGASGAASYTSDFSVDTNGWTATGGAASGNVDSIGGQDNTLRLLIDTTPGLHHLNKPSAFVIGKNYRLSGKFYIPSTNSHVDGLRLSYLGAVVIPGLNFISPSTDTWVEFNTEFIAGATTLIAFAKDGASDSVTDPGGDDVIYIKDIVITPIGLVLDLNEWGMSPGKWHDQSGNDYHGTVTGATLINANEYLYTTWIIDKNGSIGGDGQVLSKTSTGLEWINVTAAGGAGDIDGAGNGVDNWMVIWDDTNTINRSTLLYDNGTTIGIGYSGTAPTLPAGAKLAVNGVVHATSYLWGTTTTHGLKFGTGYTELTNAAGGVRLSSLNFRPNQANTNLGDTTNPWGSAVFSGRLASYQNLGTEKIIMTSIDSGQLGRSNASSEAGAMFDLKMQTVSVGAGVGASVKLQPYRDDDNNNTLTAGAAWEYFPSDNAWGISAGKLKIGSVIIDSTTQRPGRLVEHNFTVTGHGAGSPSYVTTTITHNLNNDTVVVGINRRNSGSGVISMAPWEPNSADPNNKIDVTVGSQTADTHYKIIICG